MEASRFKRRTTQTHRQQNSTQTTRVAKVNVERRIGNSAPKPMDVSVRNKPPTRMVQPRAARPIVVDGLVRRTPNPAHSLKPAAKRSAGVIKPVMAATVEPPKPIKAPAIKAITQPAVAVSKKQPITDSPKLAHYKLPAIDMELPGDESPNRFGAGVFHRRWRKARTWALRSTAVALVLVITLGGLLFSQSYLNVHKAFRGSTGTAAALKENVKPELLKGEGSGRINILLLGRGGGTHDAPDLTDTIMIASIDPISKTSTLVSVPRDLWVNVPNGGAMKLNAAWQTGEFKYLGKVAPGSTDPKAIQAGFESVDATLEEALGIDINYNVILDFQAFQQAIDTVGGVAVNVPADLVDPTMAWENANNPVLAKAGAQTFDGKHALIYARSRETSSDFARSERQRSLINSLKTKVVTAGTLSNPVKLSKLLSAFGNNVSTDLSLNNANRLYGILKQIPDASTVSAGLGDANASLVTTGNMNGQSIVLPKAGIFKYDEIQAYLRTKLQDPYLKKENAKVLVLNGTTTPGLASVKADELKSYGYNVVGMANTPGNSWTQSVLVDLTHKNKYTKNYLEKRLGITAANKLSDTSIPTNGADFVIIIGSNEATPTQP